MSAAALLESLLAEPIGEFGPDESHEILDLGSVTSPTKAYKIVSDFDNIFVNGIPVLDTGNDYHTARGVFVGVMKATGPEYTAPEGF